MKQATRWFTIAAGLSLLLGLIQPLPFGSAQSITNGDHELGQFQIFTLTGGVTVAGVGLRGTGSGTINLFGIPSAASLYRVYLYWATLGDTNTYTQPTLGGQPVAGQLIGTTSDTGWGVAHNFVYRADVTNLVSGNGSYTLAGLPNNLKNGNDSQGASLVAIYSHQASPLTTIVINDGAVALNADHKSHTDTISGFAPSTPVGYAQITYLIGDGQAEWDSGDITFNDTVLAQGVFSGADGAHWDSPSFTVTHLVDANKATTTVNNTNPDNPSRPDYLLWAATIFSVTAAPPQTSNQMSHFLHYRLFGDVTSAGVGLRGSGQGMIRLSTIPADGWVQRAFLYWATLGNSGQFTNPLLNGKPVNGQVIGTSGDTCWGTLANFVYRANVSDQLRSGRNGDYIISGLPNDLEGYGNDSQGASLVVIYSAPGLYKTVIINDGAVSLDLSTHAYTDTLGPFTVDQPNTQTHITYIVGDGQQKWNSGSITFDGHTIAGSVFTGTDGRYWDTSRFDVSALISEPDATTTINNNPPNSTDAPDCLLWAASVLSVETEPPDYFYFLPVIWR